MKQEKTIVRVLSGIVSILTPLVILMLSIRMLITPYYAAFAYSLPNFPDDPYGFTSEDRLRWSRPSIRYLINNEDISYLSDLNFANGQPIFNARELQHMEDVKGVVTGMRAALVISMVVLLTVSIIALRGDWKRKLLSAFHKGGWSLIGLIVAIFLFIMLNFNALFTWFHKIFFESGTWQFHPSNTLIRLFPLRFWRDAFFFVGLISLMLGGLVILLTRVKHTAE